ncbi:MAG: DUF2333 family protein [Desulfobacterales bacterium]|nr:DUF2333 family protein [Desulfobacterales bacterium]
MTQLEIEEKEDEKSGYFKRFVTTRVVIGILVLVTILWLFGMFMGFLEKPPDVPSSQAQHGEVQHDEQNVAKDKSKEEHKSVAVMSLEQQGHATQYVPEPAKHIEAPKTSHTPTPSATNNEKGLQKLPAPTMHIADGDTHNEIHLPMTRTEALGIAFVRATIKPMYYELKRRLWGWRANDIVQFTDNVNNFQLGVLEVTRRTVIQLTEKIARTGSSASIDPDLEQAMSCFMTNPNDYWFPSAESQYLSGIKYLQAYLKKLEKGGQAFYNRADNLIPILVAFEGLLGSCDENLIRKTDEKGKKVSSLKSDDYIYYAKGVASAIGTVLEAVLIDFNEALKSKNAIEIIMHAIELCHETNEINPWYVTEGNLSGIIANHRANLAAPISHAQFYVGLLITTLST